MLVSSTVGLAYPRRSSVMLRRVLHLRWLDRVVGGYDQVANNPSMLDSSPNLVLRTPQFDNFYVC